MVLIKLAKTHKGLKRVTHVQCWWIFSFTIFGNLNETFPFLTKWLPPDHHGVVLRPEFFFFCNLLIFIWSFHFTEWGIHSEWGIQPCFLFAGAHGLFWNQASKVFAEFSGTFCTLWPRKLRFWKVTYVFYMFYTFSPLVLKINNYKKRPDLRWILCWICHVLSWFYLRVGSTIQKVLCELL